METEFSTLDVDETFLHKTKCEVHLSAKFNIQCEFCLTPTHLLLPTKSSIKSYFPDEFYKLSLSSVYSIKKKTSKSGGDASLLIVSKKAIFYHLRFSSVEETEKTGRLLQKLLASFTRSQLISFNRNRKRISEHGVPESFLLKNQFAEMVALSDERLAFTTVNRNYTLVSTYPEHLVVPASLVGPGKGETFIKKAAEFRSRNRFPVLSFFSSQAIIFRCSQPLVGLANKRCNEDEAVLEAVKCLSKAQRLSIFDCRPKINAWGNRIAGKGFENEENYPGAALFFLDIGNVHDMRHSFFAVFAFVFADLPAYSLNEKFAKTAKEPKIDQEGVGLSTAFTDLKSYIQQSVTGSSDKKLAANEVVRKPHASSLGKLAESRWLDHLALVLRGASAVVSSVLRGEAALVRCSDGWDRTAQVCALAQLLLEAESRTIEGFLKVLYKEFFAFGHKCFERSGANHCSKEVSHKEFAPILLQFLDCARLVAKQFPRAFEFDESLLLAVADACFELASCEFLSNCEADLIAASQQVDSLCGALSAAPRERFTNPFYRKNKFLQPLHPTYSVKALDLWKGFFYRFADFSFLNGNEEGYHCQLDFEKFCYGLAVARKKASS